MVEDYESIIKKNVSQVVTILADKLVVGARWIFKEKKATNGLIVQYKAKFVAKGYSQVEGIDYEEKFSPVARYSSIISIISMATYMGWQTHQMDIKIAFLNGVIEEEVYIKQLEGFDTFERESQAGIVWSQTSTLCLVH